jgi:hypothetical protein
MATKYIVNNVSGQTIPEINSTTIISDTISATTYSNLPIPTYISSGPTAPGSAVVANETDVNINFSDGVGTAWSFSPTGMTFPDDTVQTTAYEPKYKVYTALLTQSGTNPPTAQVLENTLGFNLPNWIYDFIGEYRINLPELNVPNKVALFIGQTGYNNALFHFYQQGDYINLNTINNINQPANDLISFPVTIEIRVYN